MAELVRIRHHVAVINRIYKKKLFIEFAHVLVMPIHKSKLQSDNSRGAILSQVTVSGGSHLETWATTLPEVDYVLLK